MDKYSKEVDLLGATTFILGFNIEIKLDANQYKYSNGLNNTEK